MIRALRGLAAGAVLALATTAGGCAGAGWDDMIYGQPRGYGYETDIQGEVRGVGDRTLDLRTSNGRSYRVRYDRRTDVRYRDRGFDVRRLQRGDHVQVRIDSRGRGEPYARWVVVRRSVWAERAYDRRDERWNDRRSPPRRDEAYARTWLDGRVTRVDRRTARFEVRGPRGPVWVNVSRDAERGVRDRVVRLREGDQVRLRGRFFSDDRFEVEGFR